MVFHSNGQQIFTSARDGSLRGYNVQNGQQTFATNHGAAILDLAISPSEQILATAGENGQVRLWQTNGGGFGPQALQGYGGPVVRVVFSTDQGSVIAAVDGETPAVFVHDVQAGILQQRFTRHAGDCGVLTAPAPGIVLTGAGSSIWQWSVVAGRQITGHSQPVTSLAAAPETAQQVYSGSLDGTVRLWNLTNGQQIRQFNHGGPVNGLDVAPDGQRIASAGENNSARLWRSNGQQIAELKGDVRAKIQLSRAQQEQSASNTRLTVAKRLLDVAEKDLPVRTEAEKKLSEQLTAANQQVVDRTADLKQRQEEKLAAETSAVKASEEARTASDAKLEAEKQAALATAETQTAQTRLTQLQQVFNADNTNEALKTLVAETEAEVQQCRQREQEMKAAVAAPSQKAGEMANLANKAAQKVNETQKPYADAIDALRKAESDQNLLSLQHSLASQELKAAQDLVPVRKQSVTMAEAAVEAAGMRVTQAQEAVRSSEQPVKSVRFSPDGRLLATGGNFHSIHTWNAEDGTAIAAYAGHSDVITDLAFVSDGVVVSVSTDSSLRSWELNPGWVLERTIGAAEDATTISHRVNDVEFDRDAHRLLIASGVPSRSGELAVFDVSSGQRSLHIPQAHDDAVYSASFSPDGTRIASAGADKYVRTFDIAAGQQLRRLEGHTNYVLGVAWKGDGQQLASASADNTIKIWDAETGDQSRTIQNIERHV
ncbi:MAG: hypothetical protein KDA96_14020, partial [Planctomycetaceae bacterium]|nr:hypothetical protein [Planctomycetaceae bacterium]